jgi:hypothetical protein
MFGGLAFLSEGRMCCGVTGTDLVVRVRADEVPRIMKQRLRSSRSGSIVDCGSCTATRHRRHGAHLVVPAEARVPVALERELDGHAHAI